MKGRQEGTLAMALFPLVCARIRVVPMPLPLLLAASPLPTDAFVPFIAPQLLSPGHDANQVETFDPVGRARLLAGDLPRRWVGTYQSFEGGEPLPVSLEIAALTPIGQMVDVRGQLRLGTVTSPVQGNLNAKSDQLDLLLLGDAPGAGLEPGGSFQGLQGFTLTGWRASRLTSLGGRLQLIPAAQGKPSAASIPSAVPVRGLW